jgi:DnaJ-class molecular chaperone
MTDSEFLAEVKARIELKALGYQLVECWVCKGEGTRKGKLGTMNLNLPCNLCNASGKVWKNASPD